MELTKGKKVAIFVLILCALASIIVGSLYAGGVIGKKKKSPPSSSDDTPGPAPAPSPGPSPGPAAYRGPSYAPARAAAPVNFNPSPGSISCPPGTYLDVAGRVCRAIQEHMHGGVCDDGYIMSSTGCVLKPTSCPLGYTLPAGLSACESCPVDTYKDNTGIGACTPCQNGLYHSPVGSTSASACQMTTTCGPGQYLNVDIINQSAGCASCPVDTYKTGTGQGQCTPCPTGQTTYGQIGQTSCQTKVNWYQGTSCTSNYGFNVNNYRNKNEYCSDYVGDGQGNDANNDPCCKPAAQQTTVPQSTSPPANSCNCDSETGWDESACGGTWVAVCRPDRDGGGH